MQHFRHYLIGSPFTLLTDHSALQWMMTTSRLTRRLARWSLILQEYDFKIHHTPGVENAVPDCSSRFPLPSSEDAFREKREELGMVCYAASDQQGGLAESPATYFAYHLAAATPSYAEFTAAFAVLRRCLYPQQHPLLLKAPLLEPPLHLLPLLVMCHRTLPGLHLWGTYGRIAQSLSS